MTSGNGCLLCSYAHHSPRTTTKDRFRTSSSLPFFSRDVPDTLAACVVLPISASPLPLLQCVSISSVVAARRKNLSPHTHSLLSLIPDLLILRRMRRWEEGRGREATIFLSQSEGGEKSGELDESGGACQILGARKEEGERYFHVASGNGGKVFGFFPFSSLLSHVTAD